MGSSFKIIKAPRAIKINETSESTNNLTEECKTIDELNKELQSLKRNVLI